MQQRLAEMGRYNATASFVMFTNLDDAIMFIDTLRLRQRCCCVVVASIETLRVRQRVVCHPRPS